MHSFASTYVCCLVGAYILYTDGKASKEALDYSEKHMKGSQDEVDILIEWEKDFPMSRNSFTETRE